MCVCEATVTPDQISPFSNIYRHTSPLTTLYHLITSSTNLYWLSNSQYRHILTQYHQVPLIIHQLVRHSSANWIISLFTTHLISHAQYTWSSSFSYFYLQKWLVDTSVQANGPDVSSFKLVICIYTKTYPKANKLCWAINYVVNDMTLTPALTSWQGGVERGDWCYGGRRGQDELLELCLALVLSGFSIKIQNIFLGGATSKDWLQGATNSHFLWWSFSLIL